MKTFQDMQEGVYDPNIFKAIFLAGGPGSGKSYVVRKTTGGLGMKIVNSDDIYEKMLKDAGLEPTPEDIFSDKGQEIRVRAKKVTKRMQGNFLTGRLGVIIDGTGKDFEKIKGHRKLYQDLGYDTYMVFVNTSLEVALERNRMRERRLDDKMVEKMWSEVQNNLGKFQKLFGPDRMLIVDNSSYSNEEIIDQIERQIYRHLSTQIQNPLGKRWLRDNDPRNRDRNKPA